MSELNTSLVQEKYYADLIIDVKPKRTSELINDSGFITSTALEGYATQDFVLSYHDETKQDVLTAGTGISIVNNVISSTQASAVWGNITGTLSNQTDLQNVLTGLSNDITDINNLIPNQASVDNQLADKDFVNSSVATNTANFIGTFESVQDLEYYSGTVTNNDYAFVVGTDEEGNTVYDRYKYTAATDSWIFEYELNNSSFTAEQWASINSGITENDVTLIGTAIQPNDNISQLNNNAGYITGITSSDVISALGYTPQQSGNYATARTKIEDLVSTSITLSNAAANTDYHYGTLTSLTITANDTSDLETTIYFTTGNTITVSLPASIDYIGSAPYFEPNTTYAISILNNVLVAGAVI